MRPPFACANERGVRSFAAAGDYITISQKSTFTNYSFMIEY